MKKSLIKLIILFIIISSIFFVIVIINKNKENDLTIDCNKFGIFNLYFYDINSEEIINYGKKITDFNGDINLDIDKLKNDKFQRHFLVVIESIGSIGITTYTWVDNESPYEIRQRLYNLYKDKYSSNKISVKLNKKTLFKNYEIISNETFVKYLKVLYNDGENPVQLNRGGFLINGFNKNDKVFGNLFIINDNQIDANDTSRIWNKNIYQSFVFTTIKLSSSKDTIEIIVPIRFNGGFMDIGGDEEFQAYLDFQHYQLEEPPIY